MCKWFVMMIEIDSGWIAWGIFVPHRYRVKKWMLAEALVLQKRFEV
jgi:hypothetical protein